MRKPTEDQSPALHLKMKNYFHRKFMQKNVLKKIHAERKQLIGKYLYGLSGIEIGGSGKSFGLDGQKGSYANVDIIDAETRARNKGWKKSQLVNILSPGDKLPFNDNVFDYVFSSHVIEHFFDPVKAINEWHRVVKKGGLIFMIIPHKERTFDRKRSISDHKELIDRHKNKITVGDYIKRTEDGRLQHESRSDKDHHRLIYKEDVPDGWERFEDYNFSHHWSVWDSGAFMELCNCMKWNVVELVDTGKEYDNEFVVVLRK